ncbi:MAG: CDP-diacylglycerol--serine O-phosphatidyltransferase [Bacteroidales bacterium]|nr:CDP-diacylglycerol--serine O-phosphatidyltransferase [Bacteroidales bacterium]
MSKIFAIVRHLPNTITCCNLFCGCLSVVATFGGSPAIAAYCILMAAVFDFFDGFTARWLKAHSPIGKELDSLADMVSFGVAPASLMFVLLRGSLAKAGFPVEMFDTGWFLSLPAYLLAVFSALRLAKFNIDRRQTDLFIGVPTPAMSLFVCSIAFTASQNGAWAEAAGNIYVLSAIIAVFSYLMICELPLFSMKFKSFGWKNNRLRFIFLGVSAVFLIVFRWTGLAPVILLYIVLSAGMAYNSKRQAECTK